MKTELGRGAYGTVIGGEYKAPDGPVRTIAVKRLLTANPRQVLAAALRECGAMLDGVRGGLEVGVVPCYGVVVGPDITADFVESVRFLLSRTDANFVSNVPVVVGRWSDNRSNGWNVTLLMFWVEGAVDGVAFGDDRLFAPRPSPEATAATPAAMLHSALAKTDNWRHVPAAIVACVTRAAKFLLQHDVWNRDLKPTNMLFTPDFASRPFAAQNCLLIDFGAAINLEAPANLRQTTPIFLHPEALDWCQVRSPIVHHALDLFSITTAATTLILGGLGHPVLRCMRENAVTPALKHMLSFTALRWTRRRDIAHRLADLSDDDMRGMALMTSQVCDDIGRLVIVDGAIREREARKTRSQFIDRAKRYGWTTDGRQLGDTPQLADVAHLFSMTGGDKRPETAEGYMLRYKQILEKAAVTSLL